MAEMVNKEECNNIDQSEEQIIAIRLGTNIDYYFEVKSNPSKQTNTIQESFFDPFISYFRFLHVH